MRTNSDAEREMWKWAETRLTVAPEEELEVTEGWFPDPMSISFKEIVAECPPHLEARFEEQDGARRIFIRKRFGAVTWAQVVALIGDVRWVVAAFDQANTNGTVERLGSRGEILKRCVDDVREALKGAGIDPYPPPEEGDWVVGYGPGQKKNEGDR